jgi:hypothetical protein
MVWCDRRDLFAIAWNKTRDRDLSLAAGWRSLVMSAFQ